MSFRLSSSTNYRLKRVLHASDGTLFERSVPTSERCTLGELSKLLGLPCDGRNLLRLARAGFIKFDVGEDGSKELDMESLHKHMVRASDLSYWTPERRAEFEYNKGY
jgi:hypothetical protein